jgi:hypothetical protein
MKQERDQFKGTISRILHHSQGKGDAFRNLSNDRRDHLDVEFQSSSHNRAGSKYGSQYLLSEEIVQRDLELLDDEIGNRFRGFYYSLIIALD